jgi:hypothetical protein
LGKANKYTKYIFIMTIVSSSLLAFLNMHALKARCMQLEYLLPCLAVGSTYLYYIIAGMVIYVLRNKIRLAVKQLDFFLLLSALLFGFFAFGPYYLTANKLVVASPVAFLQYHVSGFSGIHATARWGLIFSFTLSVAVAVFLSKYTASRRLKTYLAILMFMAFLELSPGLRIPNFRNLSPYKWAPRETDIFLKNLPDPGAVLELTSYPGEMEQRTSSDNSLGYILFSRLYHKKPFVKGYASHQPHVINRYIFYPEDKKLSLGTIHNLRKFGAKYWVFHINDWPAEKVQLLKNSLAELNKIAELDQGKTLIYEDPAPRVSVGYYDII